MAHGEWVNDSVKEKVVGRYANAIYHKRTKYWENREEKDESYLVEM